jgi:soluble lytic murein transglycosylase
LTPKRWPWLVALLALVVVGTPLWLRVYYRVDHLPLILATCREQGVKPHLVAAMIFTESRFRSDARSVAGAVGLMQLMPETAAEVADRLGLVDYKVSDLTDPETNITLGVAYIKELRGRFGNTELALAAYNAGPTVVESWRDEGRPILYPETRHYVRAVLRHQEFLEELYPEWDTP